MPISDIVQPHRIISGQPAVFTVSDIFFTQSTNISFGNSPEIQATYDAENNLLTLQPSEHVVGLHLVPFQVDGQQFHLPVIVDGQSWHTFTYRPQNMVQEVSVFGAFNSWNRDQHYLSDTDNDGTYRIRIPIEPGRYEYKFFVDGKELIDPANPVKVPNPFGDYNSVIEISAPFEQSQHLHILRYDSLVGKQRFIFYLEQPGNLPFPKLVALLDNTALGESAIDIIDNRVEVLIDENRLAGKHVLRIGVAASGNAGGLLEAVLIDGRPAGSKGFQDWQDAIMYSLMIDRFNDGNLENNAPVQHPDLSEKANFQGGDLQGVLDKLKEGYFSDLGVTVLWLSPVNQNTDKAHREWPEPHRYFSGYHGYWPTDPTRVDERFGDMSLLKQVVEEAHRQDMKVLLDFVANHVHEDHPYFRQNRGWFGDYDLPDGRKNIRLWDEHRLTTWFEPFLPSFDFQGSERALNAMTDNALWWLQETGVDGFRHDAVKHIPNSFWRTLTRKIKSAGFDRKIFQIGETFGSYSLIHSYVNNGQLDAQFNFNLFYPARSTFLDPQADFANLANELTKTATIYGNHHLMGNLIDSHDQIRFMALADGDLTLQSSNAKELGWTDPPQVDDERSYRRVRLYQSFIMSIPGIPVVYYGDEFGMSGADDPDNRRMMRFGDELSAAEKDMLTEVRKIVQLRRNHSALRYGDTKVLLADKACLAILRSDFNERILIVINKAEGRQQRVLSLPPWYELQRAKHLLRKGSAPIEENTLLLDPPGLSVQAFLLQ